MGLYFTKRHKCNKKMVHSLKNFGTKMINFSLSFHCCRYSEKYKEIQSVEVHSVGGTMEEAKRMR